MLFCFYCLLAKRDERRKLLSRDACGYLTAHIKVYVLDMSFPLKLRGIEPPYCVTHQGSSFMAPSRSALLFYFNGVLVVSIFEPGGGWVVRGVDLRVVSTRKLRAARGAVIRVWQPH